VSEALGGKNVAGNITPTTVAEDFAFYLNKTQGAFFVLGQKEKGRIQAPLHSSQFDFNDNSIKNGILAFCAVAIKMFHTEEN
jgi:metal-dependent amidase/aminoacylase/carboxypeptidase family protein